MRSPLSMAWGRGSFTSESYIKMLDEQAQQAAQELAKTGRIRVIVQDNGSIHTSYQVQQKWSLRGGDGSLPVLLACILLRNESYRVGMASTQDPRKAQDRCLKTS